jgi:signal transduction histidine kinase
LWGLASDVATEEDAQMNKRAQQILHTGWRPKELIIFTRRILQQASLGTSRIEFLRSASRLLLELSDCDALELRTFGDVAYRWRSNRRPTESFSFDLSESDVDYGEPDSRDDRDWPDLVQPARNALSGQIDPSAPCFTEHGSFWTGDLAKTLAAHSCGSGECLGLTTGITSLALIPFVISDRDTGLLRMESGRRDVFVQDAMEFYECVAQTLGIGIASRRAQAALNERVKEFTCLYGIARTTRQLDRSVQGVLEEIAALLPPAWQYPDVAASRILFDGKEYGTTDFKAVRFRQSARIVVHGERRGTVDVGYVDEKPEFAEGPFLKEEDDLLGAVAREISLFIEQSEAARQSGRLEEQLRHADRLATIGQLAAGVAHEINEPLGGILGCAQLARKAPDLAKETAADLDDIITASLHAREVVKNLMLFARQTPSKKTRADLNRVVEQSMSFIEARCAKEGVDLVRDLAPDLPQPLADLSQLQQVLVNLVVNALQAMPDGGTLTVATHGDDRSVALVVEDTGVGMSEETKERIFDPFFTTKDVGKGTGLGLSVVDGIVTAHGGSIKCESRIGGGTRFEIQLPRSGSPETDALKDSENE